jgi:hypothetical protein
MLQLLLRYREFNSLQQKYERIEHLAVRVLAHMLSATVRPLLSALYVTRICPVTNTISLLKRTVLMIQ